MSNAGVDSITMFMSGYCSYKFYRVSGNNPRWLTELQAQFIHMDELVPFAKVGL